MTAGVKVYEAIRKMAELNNLTTSANRINLVDESGKTLFNNKVVLKYDPSDSGIDKNASEFIYIHKGNKQLAEGFVMPDGTSPWFRVNSESHEFRMGSPDALAGVMFKILWDAIHETGAL